MGKKRKEALVLSIKTSTDGIQENINLEQRLLVAGPFSGEIKGDLSKVHRVKDVTADNLDAKLANQKVRLNFSVPNLLAGDGKKSLQVRAQPRSMRDFDPDMIASGEAFQITGDPNEKFEDEALEQEVDPKTNKKRFDPKGNPIYKPRKKKQNEVADALALADALEQLQIAVDSADPESFYSMVYEVAKECRADRPKAEQALASGDILRTLKLSEQKPGS
ncbi:MAG: type VI secretion system contractile sheath small subunit [Polyangia bacterium]